MVHVSTLRGRRRGRRWTECREQVQASSNRDPTPVGDVVGTAVVKAFDQERGRSGIVDHEQAREAGFDPVSETITAGSRSGNYPGAAETRVTLTADRESGRLLGGTIVGTDRAAIRIDIVAMALEGDATVAELGQPGRRTAVLAGVGSGPDRARSVRLVGRVVLRDGGPRRIARP